MIPSHERRILEAHIRGVALSKLAFAEAERPLNEYEKQQLKDLIKMRMRGLPLQYLIGNQAFYGREFYVNTTVLIPRPETEGLVELALENLPPARGELPVRGLEFGTGTGCIAITIVLERPHVLMTATEASPEAYAVANENSKRYRTTVDFVQVSETPALWQYDGFAGLDFLISNPPYLVMDDEIADDVRDNEPPEALFTPDGDPMYFYRFLAELLKVQVKEDGFGVFEIAEQRGEETSEIFRAYGFKTDVRKDLAGRDRYLLVKR